MATGARFGVASMATAIAPCLVDHGRNIVEATRSLMAASLLKDADAAGPAVVATVMSNIGSRLRCASAAYS